MIGRHEGDPKWVVPGGGEVDEPRRLEHDPKVEPADVEVAAGDALVGDDYRVQILDVHGFPSVKVGPHMYGDSFRNEYLINFSKYLGLAAEKVTAKSGWATLSEQNAEPDNDESDAHECA
jgi:hypothetical protein